MCGIAGFYIKDFESRDLIESMGEVINHRGPDEKGQYIDHGTHLAHRRLSIIDLSEGQQPLFNHNKSKVIVYNGEIYNYKELRTELEEHFTFNTNSDTEVLLHAYEAWGENCLDRFNGMFSFCIYDITEKKLFLARDRMGQKPLYYSMQGSKFAFASELGALKHLPQFKFKLNENNLAKYFAHEYIPCPGTLYDNVFKLEPGHTLNVDLSNSRLEKKRWWNTNFGNVNLNRSYNDTKDELIEKLKESLNYRMVSDVPVGIFLSGGVDSSACLALLKKCFPDQTLKTFSVAFAEKSFNESSYSQQMAKKFNTEHHETTLTAKKMLDVLPQIRNNMQDPIADASIIPTYLLCQFASSKVKVALGGDGADELLSGYPTFYAHSLCKYLYTPKALNKALNSLASFIPVSMNNLSLDFKIKQTLKGLAYSNPIRNQIWLGAATETELNQLMPESNPNLNDLFSELLGHWDDTKIIKGDKNRINDIYIKTYMNDDILTKVDRASMMNSLEVRAPFLDFNLINFINTIPANFKMKGSEGKYILKDALTPYLPHNILYRQKKGFGMPIADWFRSDLKELLHEEIQNAHPIFSKKYLNTLFNDHQAGKVDQRKKLFSYLMVNHLIN